MKPLQHSFANALGVGVDVLAVRLAALVDVETVRWKTTGREGAGEDEASEVDAPTLLQHVSQTKDVRAFVLGVVVAREVVVRGEVNDDVPGAVLLVGATDFAKHAGE